MNTDVEDLLREGMERFTRDLRAPAGLAGRVARRRRRRLALRSAGGAATALTAVAVTLVAVMAPWAGDNGTAGPVAAAAYVVKRVDSALSSAEPGQIAQVRVTIHGAVTVGGTMATTTAEEWSYGDRWRSVSYSPAGHPVYDEGSGTSSVYTLVSYPTRTWARQRGVGRPVAVEPGHSSAAQNPGSSREGPQGTGASSPRGCEPVLWSGPGGAGASGKPKTVPHRAFVTNPADELAVPLLFQPGLPGIGFTADSPPSTAARDLRTAVSCGTLTVAGRQRVDGIEAIELTSRQGSLISETIWVNPGTYLPVRVVVRSAFGQTVRLTADISWLAPTAQNLAKLTVPVPSGFRRVPLAEALGLTLLQTPGGRLSNVRVVCPPLAGPACKDGTSASGSG